MSRFEHGWKWGMWLMVAGGVGLGVRLMGGEWEGRGRGGGGDRRGEDEATVVLSAKSAGEREPADLAVEVDMSAAIRRLMREDVDHFQDTRVRELIRRLPVGRRGELAGLLKEFGTSDWVQRAIIEGWASVDGPGVVAQLGGESMVQLRRWQGDIVRFWARTDPEAAERWVRSLPEHARQGLVRVALVEAISEADPDRAFGLLRETGWLHTEPNAGRSLIKNWAARDLTEAWAALREMDRELGGRRGEDSASSSPPAQLMSAFFDGARVQETDELRRFVTSLSEEELVHVDEALARGVLAGRPDLVRVLMDEWGADGPGGSVLTVWAEQAPVDALAMVQEIGDPELRALLMGKALGSAEIGASDGLRWLAGREDGVALLELALATQSEADRVRHQECLASRAVDIAPELASHLWTGLDSEAQKELAPHYFSALGQSNPAVAAAHFESLPPGEVRDAAVARYCFGLAGTDPERAMSLALAEADSGRRAEAAGLALAKWAASDAPAAEAALRQAARSLDLEAVGKFIHSAAILRIPGGQKISLVGQDTEVLQPVINELLSVQP